MKDSQPAKYTPAICKGFLKSPLGTLENGCEFSSYVFFYHNYCTAER